ncbi:ROK family protein [Winogradskyella bathintestinalis]|uniref:ROK family protein n=1 Tax=Winogradskyella bathintestinalis TaxID=3035208 RepID=A0ABT7ZX02_9FLAO|nr:ROK family protein [Winogradskyella bathintestinalis]MDN3493533.1 ROK family protein [Winogradskyella bathintestinalis]
MNNKFAVGIDIGGSHLAIAIVDVQKKEIVKDTKLHFDIDSKQDALPILESIVAAVKETLNAFNQPILGIGVSIPGPLDYENGISKIFNCNKYDSLFGADIKNYLYTHLTEYIDNPSKIVFMNDAACFTLGEAWINNWTTNNVTAVTLGTGIGSGFMSDGKIVVNGDNTPPNDEVFNLPFKNKRAEDWLGSEWFLNAYQDTFKDRIENVKVIADKANTSNEARQIFQSFGTNLGDFLSPILRGFKTEYLILGGSIAKSYPLFIETLKDSINNTMLHIHISEETEDSAILGAVQKLSIDYNELVTNKRLSSQFLMPINIQDDEVDSQGYEIYPSFEINEGVINQGFKSLAKELSTLKSVVIDGYLGVYWDEFMLSLTSELKLLGVNSIAFAASAAFKDSEEVDDMIAPFLGGDDPVFGKMFTGELSDFYNTDKLNNINEDDNVLSIIYGSGASLSNWDSKIVYVDIPKNEIQYRSRSGALLNIGAQEIVSPKPQYKRMFFVDWIALNKHKADLINRIDYIVDGQFSDDVSWTTGNTLRHGLDEMSQNVFRPRPWFASGVWGGQWIKDKIDGLQKDIINYAWSFELIAPENGIVLSHNKTRLEVSFDVLQYHDNNAILGAAAETFGFDFPIRFNFLDTYDGDNLSVQCHPTPEYVRDNFGDKFTQDETYYILDAEPGAEVYLGFKEGVKKEEFHNALLESHEKAKKMDVDKYVQKFIAKKHDLFLIPRGTIHCSGIDNMVLEISTTKYLYTFKMYDWMRLDLDGSPRPLNIQRGMDNVNFDCIGDKVQEEYISKETIIDEGIGYKTKRLSMHSKHFYELFRFEFNDEIEINTNNQCHILNLVEGSKIKVITGEKSMIIQYAETFVIPAKTKQYKMINLGSSEAKVIQSNVKNEFCSTRL